MHMKVIKEPHRLKPLFRFLNRVKRDPPRKLQSIAIKAVSNIWNEIDCLSCANCCKTMTPTYTNADIKKIASYLQISTDAMKKRWLKKERGTGDWINKTTPCQFLNPGTNMCNVYEVRPADCAGFPHLTKKKFVEYLHVHQQNLDKCPATFKLVERMNEMVEKGISNL